MIQIASSVLYFCYLAHYRPYNCTFFNGMEIFNEASLVVASYLLIEFTDIEGNLDLKFNIGWFMTALMIMNTVVNFIAIIGKVV
mmetsp:Transcript_17933/g.17132  ORF Transcript_17933/g.17132 Transcript_17933/m.17132 type:complete len:84 (+) Transcript_17933:84-335(+)